MYAQEFKYRLYLLRRPLAILALLLFFSAGVYIFSAQSNASQQNPEKTPLSERIRKGETERPEFTLALQAKLEKGPSFDALASYTDQGFEPNTITISTGETVRFTNNSSNDVWIGSRGTDVEIYPRTQQVCGSSDLDSCEPFAPMDFWQFRFDVRGNWIIVNNLDKTKNGRVIVR